MNIVIRTDASIEIGTGHVMRCLTLAKQLRNEGANICFICRTFSGNSIELIKKEGFLVKSLYLVEEENNIEWIKKNLETDCGETKMAIQELSMEVDFLIVDHYGIDARWETVMRSSVNKIMVIDDLADRLHDCDLLLDQNYYTSKDTRYLNLVPDSCIQLLGPGYVLLREEFLNINPDEVKRTGEINNLLIFFGGTDPTGETIKAIEVIQDDRLSEINIDVIVGASNPSREQIEMLCNQLPNVSYHCQVNNIAEMMLNADLSIGAGGATTWERCYLTLPSLVVITAQNQLELTIDVAEAGALINMGWHKYVTVSTMKNNLIKLLEHPSEITNVIESCKEVLDSDVAQKRPVINRILEMAL